MAEPLQAFLHLQRQVVIASQPDLLRDATSTPTASDISKMLILEKYLGAIKATLHHMDSQLRLPEWEDRRQFIDTKVSALEHVLQHKKRMYSPYLAQFQGQMSNVEGKPFDFSAFVKSDLSSPAQPAVEPSLDQVAPTSPSIISPTTMSVDREELLRRRRPPPTKEKSSDTTKPAFQQDHDALAAEMVTLARNLKKNNLAFSELLKKDHNALHEAELLMETNSTKFKREHDDLKSFRRSSWSSTKRTILIIFLLLGLFVVMYLFIKITSK